MHLLANSKFKELKTIKSFFRSFLQFGKRTDHLVLGICMLCSGVSFFLLWSIYLAGYIVFRVLLVQLAATAIGIVVACVISMIDYHTIVKFWKFFLPLSTGLVLLTFLIGEKRASYIDDKAWLRIPGINLTFQPSEILKLAFILTFALHLEKAKDSLNEGRTLFGLCLHGGAFALLIALQGDLGTALVFAVIFCCMIFAAGLSVKYLIPAVGLGLLASPLVWLFVLDDDKRARVLTVFNPALDPSNKGYQQMLGLRSIGSGQVWGKGLFSGDVQYIPEMHNDFIFAFAGEALGFVGSLAIILVLGILCVAILMNARRAKDLLGRYICVGVFGVIAFQSIVGIGMCLSLLPVVGITLPFFSAGGTSVVMTYAVVGLVLTVHRFSYDGLFAGK